MHIIYNRKNPRIRFTIDHEMGHLFLGEYEKKANNFVYWRSFPKMVKIFGVTEQVLLVRLENSL